MGDPRRLPLTVLSPARPSNAQPGPLHHPCNGQPATDRPKDKCGVFGIWGGPKPATTTYFALYAQQHRGQESAGLAVSDGRELHAVTGMGLVPEVLTPPVVAALDTAADVHIEHEANQNGRRADPTGSSAAPAAITGSRGGAIGHNRYSTAGGSKVCNAQPLLESYVAGQVAVAHNGNLINADAFRRIFERQGHLFHTTSDTEIIVHLLASPAQQAAIDPLAATLRHLEGAFSLVVLFPDRIEAARDPWGWRPLVLGRFRDGRWCVASETVALDVIGAEFIREVEPGEIVTLSDAGLATRRFAERVERHAHCVFEHVYFANPSSVIFGQTVQEVREQLGAVLAREAPVDADYVMPMPDSGRSAAAGYARASGIAYREGIVPNRYVGRTFIKPTQAERASAVRLKLNVIRAAVEGKRIIVVDDSIVRGTTTREKMLQLRQAGAREIHVRISCPPIRHPCYFGVDFASRDQLIAHGRTVEEVRRYLGVDSLHYLSLDGLLSCMSRPASEYCTACYSGEYRLDPDHPTTDELATSQMTMF